MISPFGGIQMRAQSEHAWVNGGDTRCDSNCDMNRDGRVVIFGIVIAFGNYGDGWS